MSFLVRNFSAAETEGIASLGLSFPALIAQAITFLTLFFIIKKFAMPKIVKTLEERRNTINRGLHLTAEMDKLKTELDNKVEQTLQKARTSADKIIAEANTESGRIIRSAEEAAGRRTEAILKDAQGKIEREIAEAKQNLKVEMANLLAESTGAILRQKIDSKEDRKLIETYLKEVMK